MKVYKQPKLFLERIDGSTPAYESWLHDDKKVGIFYIYHTVGAFMYAFKQFDGNDDKGLICQIDFYRFEEYFRKRNMDREIYKLMSYVIKIDPYAKNFSMCYKLYNDNKHKNYVMSKNLTKYLEKISLDVPADVLPSEFFAYFEPNDLYDDVDNTKVHCVFTVITKVKDIEIMMLAYITDSSSGINKRLYEFHTLNIILDREKTLDVLCEENNKKARQQKTQDSINGHTAYRVDDHKISESSALRTIVNSILYVNSPNEEFIEKFNEFSDKEKKRKVQEKNYSSKKFFRIGYENAEFLKLMVEKSIEVGWHTKMQPYGPNRKYRKRIIVGSYIRKQKNYFDR